MRTHHMLYKLYIMSLAADCLWQSSNLPCSVLSCIMHMQSCHILILRWEYNALLQHCVNAFERSLC